MSQYRNTVIALAMLAVSPLAHGVEFGAFGDIRMTDSNAAGEDESFMLGQFDLYARQEISANTSVFIEYVFETGSDGEIVTDVERLHVERRFSDALTLGMGRYHAPLGYWNRNFHHGVLIQDTVSRPSFLDFEDEETATLPMHVIGVMATGEWMAGPGDLGYELFVGNASSVDSTTASPRTIDVNNVAAPGEEFLIGARGTITLPERDIRVGVFAMNNPVFDSCDACATARTKLVGQIVSGVDVRFDPGRWDILAEYYFYDNTDKVAAADGDATAYYVQLGYRVSDLVKLVYRHEDLDIDNPADAYFALLGSASGAHDVAVARLDLDESNALFVEFTRFDPDGAAQNENTWTLSWAFLMF